MYDALPATLESVRHRIHEAARRSGRAGDDVTLVAVTKGHPPAAVEAALAAGLRDLGENRVEALEERAVAFGGRGIRWHLVGRLQSRKAARAAELAGLVHSVDSLRLAERLGRIGVESEERVSVLLQVNTAGEETKSGVTPGEAPDVLGRMLEIPGLAVEGLMTMAPFTDEEGVLRAAFRDLRRIHEEARRTLEGYRGMELSMGMSNDFGIAVEEGSTMVRLGTVLFGERPI